MTEGLILNIQRFCTHDGPGIRTTVFFKGCPLRCDWCHNPESQGFGKELSYLSQACVGCGACMLVCPEGAHRVVGHVHTFERDLCQACFRCAEACTSGALDVVGRWVTVEDVLLEAEKDRVFYATSGGGLTLSGGEPTAQPAFALALLQAAHTRGLHTCVETCGFGPVERFGALVPYVDLFLWDIKDSDPVRHQTRTGVALEPIWEALRYVDTLGGKTLLRCILMEDVNMATEHLDAITELCAELAHCQGIDLIAYHPFGQAKLARLGAVLPEAHIAPDAEEMAWASAYVAARLRELMPDRQT